MNKEKIIITGMTCAACSATVEKAINNLDGIKASVNLATDTLTFEILGSSKYSVLDIEKTISKVGYGTSSINEEILWKTNTQNVNK